jgi:hypothetical protein
VPEKFWDATAGKVSDEKALAGFINEHLAFKAAEDSKRLTLPADPNAYKAELPTDFVVPQGVEYKFNDADPLLAQAKILAHQLGIPQEGFSKLLGLYAGAQVSNQQVIDAARSAEVVKLGPTGPARVDAADTFFKAHLGEADGKQLMSRMVTASDFTIVEKLMARFASQGGGSFSTARREADTGAKLTPEQYDKLSYSERKEYAAKHAGSASH